MNYVYGLLCIAGGVWLVIGTQNVMRMFGRVEWAEEHLGMWGGSRTFTKWIGIALIALGFIFMGGWFGPIIKAIFSSGNR